MIMKRAMIDARAGMTPDRIEVDAGPENQPSTTTSK
jgi:hypothetical protein